MAALLEDRREDAHEHVRQCYSLVGTEIGLHLQVVSVWYVGDSPHLASIAIDKTFHLCRLFAFEQLRRWPRTRS